MLFYHGKEDTTIDCKKAKHGYDMMIGERPNFKLNLIPYLGHSVFAEQFE